MKHNGRMSSSYTSIPRKKLKQGKFCHFMFDYDEKVLLPRMQKQPGQLHFLISLKFDINGVTNSNIGTCLIHGLTQGALAKR